MKTLVIWDAIALIMKSLWWLKAMRGKRLGHQQPWYWPSYPGLLLFQNQKGKLRLVVHRSTYKHLQRRITRGCWCKSPYFFTCRLLFLNARRKSAVYSMEKKIRHDLCRRWHPMNHIAKEMSNDTNRNYYWTTRLNVSPLQSPLIIWTSCYTLSSPFSIVQHSTNEDIETQIMTKNQK